MSQRAVPGFLSGMSQVAARNLIVWRRYAARCRALQA